MAVRPRMTKEFSCTAGDMCLDMFCIRRCYDGSQSENGVLEWAPA